MDNNHPAHPVNTANHDAPGANEPHPGMSMRQYYKAMAMQGLLAANESHDSGMSSVLAGDAGKIADAMLAEDQEAEG